MKLKELLETCLTEVNKIRVIPTDSDDNEGIGELFLAEDVPILWNIIKAQTTSAYLNCEVASWRVYNNCLSILVKVEELNE